MTPPQRPLTPNAEFAAIAPVSRVQRTVAALIANGFEAAVAATGAEARERVLELLPVGAEVFNATSQSWHSDSATGG